MQRFLSGLEKYVVSSAACVSSATSQDGFPGYRLEPATLRERSTCRVNLIRLGQLMKKLALSLFVSTIVAAFTGHSMGQALSRVPVVPVPVHPAQSSTPTPTPSVSPTITPSP